MVLLSNSNTKGVLKISRAIILGEMISYNMFVIARYSFLATVPCKLPAPKLPKQRLITRLFCCRRVCCIRGQINKSSHFSTLPSL